MNKTAATLASIVAALGISAGTATAVSAKTAEFCIGKKVYAHQNGETLNGACGADTFIVGQYKRCSSTAATATTSWRAARSPISSSGAAAPTRLASAPAIR